MKENAILIRHLDIQKVSVDFSNIDNIYQLLNADRLSTIHTQKTQELSKQLGIHLMGFVNREGDDVNNRMACEISGYDYIGGFLFLCKTDDKFNPLPFNEKELESVYNYLTENEPVEEEEDNGMRDFIDHVLPDFGIDAQIYQMPEVPYVVLMRYDLRKLNDKQLMELGGKLFEYSENILKNFEELDNGVYLSNTDKYYIKNYKEGMDFYNILIQFKGEEEILIYDAEAVIHKGFLNEGKEEVKPHDGSLYPEEAIDELDQMDEEGE